MSTLELLSLVRNLSNDDMIRIAMRLATDYPDTFIAYANNRDGISLSVDGRLVNLPESFIKYLRGIHYHQKIPAIKELRSITGLALREALSVIEWLGIKGHMYDTREWTGSYNDRGVKLSYVTAPYATPAG